MCKAEHVRDHFEEDFPQWAHAINSYCKDTQIRSSALQQETTDYSASMDDGIDTEHTCTCGYRELENNILVHPCKACFLNLLYQYIVHIYITLQKPVAVTCFCFPTLTLQIGAF